MSKAEEKANEYADNCMLSVNHKCDVRDAYWDGYEQAMKDAEERIRNWERDFDDHYLTFDNCGYARIMQTDLEEDMIKVIKGEEYTK